MLDSFSISSILVGLVGVLVSTSMFFLVTWQGVRRQINLIMAIYLASTAMWSSSMVFARLSPLFGYDGSIFVYVNGSSMVVSGVVLFAFALVYRRLWVEESYGWLRYFSLGLVIESALLIIFIFRGVIITDILINSDGSVAYNISPLGYIMIGVGLLSFVGTFTILIKDNQTFWQERVFWGTVCVAFGVLSVFLDDIVSIFSIPAAATMVSVLIFARFILQENVFNPLLQLNEQLEDANQQLSAATNLARGSESSLRNVVENTSDLIWSVDQYHKLTMMNSTANAFFELLFQQPLIEGDLFFKYMTREQESQWRSLYARAFNGRRFSVERRYHFETLASRFDLEISFNPSFNEAYEIVSVSVFARDITRYKETERKLTQQALTFDNISDSIILIDLDWMITDCNPATIQILGYTKDELVGQSAEFFYERKIRFALRDGILEAMAKRGRWEGDIPFLRKNGLQGVSEAVVLPLRDDRGERLATLMVSRDVTERKRREEQFREAKDAAEAANRAKSAFLASMSHELRTPLNAIIGYGEMLQEDFLDHQEPHISLDLHRIVKSGRHLLNIVNTVLDLSKVEAGKVEVEVESFRFIDLVDDVVSAVYPIASANDNRIEIDVSDDLPMIHSDMIKLRQILINVLGNASKFTSNGVISLTVRFEFEKVNRCFVIEVTDTGIGMSDEAISTIFNAFIQADASTTRRYQGTGLGLTISQRYVELLGGTIFVTSELGVGSQFVIRIPEYLSATSILLDDKNAVDIRKDDTTVSRQKLNPDGDVILVVDDDPSTRDTLTRWLYEKGYHVYTAPTGKRALELAPQIRPKAIILDLILPDISSWDVLFALKRDESIRKSKVVFSILLEDLQQGFAFAADGVLLKTAEQKDLVALFAGFSEPLCAIEQSCRILLIDDNLVLREVVQKWTHDRQWQIDVTSNIYEALKMLETTFSYHVVMVDLDLFSQCAFELVEQIHRQKSPTALVFISDRENITEAGQRFSTKSTMAMVSAGLYDRSKWLHLLTDQLL